MQNKPLRSVRNAILNRVDMGGNNGLIIPVPELYGRIASEEQCPQYESIWNVEGFDPILYANKSHDIGFDETTPTFVIRDHKNLPSLKNMVRYETGKTVEELSEEMHARVFCAFIAKCWEHRPFDHFLLEIPIDDEDNQIDSNIDRMVLDVRFTTEDGIRIMSIGGLGVKTEAIVTGQKGTVGIFFGCAVVYTDALMESLQINYPYRKNDDGGYIGGTYGTEDTEESHTFKCLFNTSQQYPDDFLTTLIKNELLSEVKNTIDDNIRTQNDRARVSTRAALEFMMAFMTSNVEQYAQKGKRLPPKAKKKSKIRFQPENDFIRLQLGKKGYELPNDSDEPTDGTGTGTPKSPHARRGHIRNMKKSGKQVYVSPCMIKGNAVGQIYVL